MTFELDTAELVGTLFESVLFGIALLLGMRTVILVHQANQTSHHSLNKIFLITPILLILFAVIHLGVDWWRLIHAFIVGDLPRPARKGFLLGVANGHYFTKGLVYVLQVLIGDGILVYRVYMVWQRNVWYALLPFMCWLASFAVGIVSLRDFWSIQDIFSGQLKTLIGVYFIMTIVTNILSTSLILLRLGISTRSHANHLREKHYFQPAIAVLLESGAIYTLYNVIIYVLFVVENNVQIVLYNGIVSLIPILFSFVLLRIVKPYTASEQGHFSHSITSDGTHSRRKHALQPGLTNGVSVNVDVRRFDGMHVEMGPIPRGSTSTSDKAII